MKQSCLIKSSRSLGRGSPTPLLSGAVFFLFSLFISFFFFPLFFFFFSLRSAGETLLVSVRATVQVYLHPALHLPNSDPEPDLLTWLFGLTLDLPHHYQPGLSIWTVVWTGSALLLHRCSATANFVGRIPLLPALLWVWTPSLPSLPLLLPDTYQISCIRTWSLLTDLSHSNYLFKLSLGCWGKVLGFSALILNYYIFFHTLFYSHSDFNRHFYFLNSIVGIILINKLLKSH